MFIVQRVLKNAHCEILCGDRFTPPLPARCVFVHRSLYEVWNEFDANRIPPHLIERISIYEAWLGKAISKLEIPYNDLWEDMTVLRVANFFGQWINIFSESSYINTIDPSSPLVRRGNKHEWIDRAGKEFMERYNYK